MNRLNMQKSRTDPVYNHLKKRHGEAFARVIYGAGLHKMPNIEHILEFAGNNSFDAAALVPFIYSDWKHTPTKMVDTGKNPLELLGNAGYDAFVVENAEQKNSIQKYFRPHEQLCTFTEPERHKDYYIIHAIKHGANKIQPSNTPKREDEYGASVISIQIRKKNGAVKITNRYNHSVDGQDATFGNNPDNIIAGLTMSLSKYFNIDINTFPRHFRTVHGQFVQCAYEIDGVYFGPQCYIRQNGLVRINTDYQIMFDFMVLDTRTGELRSTIYPDPAYNVMKSIFKDAKIKIENDKQTPNKKSISANGTHIITIENYRITEMTLPWIKCIEEPHFCDLFQKLTALSMPDVEFIGDNFMSEHQLLKTLDIPKVREWGHSFLFNNRDLVNLNAPNVERIGCQSLGNNNSLTRLYMPKLYEIWGPWHDILPNNTVLTDVQVPKLRRYNPMEFDRLQNIVAKNLANNRKTKGR